MTENEIITETQEFTSVEQNPYEIIINSDKQAKPEGKVGRPVKNGRSEKISLYITKQTANKLDDLRKYDEADLQDLLNEALDVYFQTRTDDLEFLREQEKARKARKARQLKTQ